MKTLKNGYQQKYMGLNPDGSENWQYVHRLKAGAKPGDGTVVHHKDGNKANSSKPNLEKLPSKSAHNHKDKNILRGTGKKK